MDSKAVEILYPEYVNKMIIIDYQNELITKLQSLKSKISFVSSDFEGQMVWFKDNLLKDYLNWYTAFIDLKNERKKLIFPVSKLRYGNIIFNSKIGFNFVKNVDVSEHTSKLNLSRCGYPFVDGEMEMKNVQFGSKVVIFK